MTAHKKMVGVPTEADSSHTTLEDFHAGGALRLASADEPPPEAAGERTIQFVSRLAGPIALGVGVAVVASLIWG